LHVDDDQDIREIVVFSLEGIGGFEVRSCASAEEALNAVDKFNPDVALLDLMMPEVDGEQLFQMLRDRPTSRLLPVIFITAQALESTKRRLVSQGALEVISKPFDPLTLPTQITAILDKNSNS
jgi:CheY-like chemotaxis protein